MRPAGSAWSLYESESYHHLTVNVQAVKLQL